MNWWQHWKGSASISDVIIRQTKGESVGRKHGWAVEESCLETRWFNDRSDYVMENSSAVTRGMGSWSCWQTAQGFLKMFQDVLHIGGIGHSWKTIIPYSDFHKMSRRNRMLTIIELKKETYAVVPEQLNNEITINTTFISMRSVSMILKAWILIIIPSREEIRLLWHLDLMW